MIPQTLGGLLMLAAAFALGALYGRRLYRLERAELRHALHKAAGLVDALRAVAPLGMTALRRRSVDFVDRWRQ